MKNTITTNRKTKKQISLDRLNARMKITEKQINKLEDG
jgi:cell division protein FtsB